jgi:hypothetical protein
MKAVVHCAVAAVLLTACGHSSSVAPGGGTPTGSGATVLNVPNLTVASGATLTLSAPTIYISTGAVEIDGTVVLAAGASIAIFAPQITIKGTIGAASLAASSSRRITSTRRPSDTPLHLQPNMLLSDNIIIDQQGGLTASPGIDLAAQSPGGTMTISGGLSTADGASATALSPATPGGNIEIGTAAAIDDVRTAALAAGFITAAFAPASVTISGQLHAGFGGNGYNDPSGVVNGGSVTVTGTDGAAGGNIEISAGSLTAAAATLQAGGGGFGGSAGPFPGGFGPGAGQLAFATPVDGVGQGSAGLNLVATTGKGGAGGSVTIPATTSGQPRSMRGGLGGANGNANVRAGNGGPAGRGGTTMLIVGGYGSNGAPAINLPPPLVTAILLTGGGSGGAAAPAGVNGGSAGAVTLSGSGLAGATIVIANYANAGRGFGTCSSPDVPNTGSNAGAPASLTDGKLPYTATNSFNGANGGDGLTAGGSGTLGGTDDTGKKIGTDGVKGAVCPPYGPLVINPPSGTSSFAVTQTFTATQTGWKQTWGVSITGNCSIAPATPSGPGPTNVVVSHTGAPLTAQDNCLVILSGPTPTGTGQSVDAFYRATFTP